MAKKIKKIKSFAISQQPVKEKKSGQPLNTVKALFVLLGCLLVALVATIIVSIVLGTQSADVADDYVFKTNIVVGDKSITGMTKADAETLLAADIQTMLETTNITFYVNGIEKSLTAAELNCSSNIEDIFRLAKQFNGRSDSLSNYNFATWDGTKLKTTLMPSFDYNTLLVSLDNIKDKVDTEPQDATISFDAEGVNVGGKDADGNSTHTPFVYVDAVEGFTVDLADLAQQIVDKYGTGEKIEAVGEAEKAHYSLEDVKKNTTLIATYTTYFSHSATTNRGKNIQKWWVL